MKEMAGLKFYEDYEDEESVVEKIEAHIEEHGSYDYEEIIIGYWEDAYDSTPEDIINYMVENKAKFPNLKSIYLGDMEGEECEISWINHTDTAALLNEFKLEKLTIQGAMGLRLNNAKCSTLKEFTIISGGIPKDALEDIAKAELPNLEHLELYLGVEDYGFDGDISTLEPFMKRSNFPKVKYLGLKNSEIQDGICEKILNSDILEGLEVLDLSLGTLSDVSAELILKNIDKLTHLRKLDLTYNYISDELIDELEEAFEDKNVELLVSKEDVYDDDEDYRYPYITE